MPAGSKAHNRDLAALALATGKTVAEAASAAGVSGRSVSNWLNEKAFKDRVAELRGEAVRRAAGVLSDAMTEAAMVLRGLLTSASESIRLRAAVELLHLSFDAVELAEMRKELDELRETLETLGT